MKVSILTFYRADNYGALLQCYNLARFIEDLGHQVEIIDLDHHQHKIPLKRRIKRFFDLQGMTKFRKKNFSFVSDKVDFKSIYSLNDADLYLVGSDQVWNPQIVGDKLKTYFFDFLEDNKQRASYAASFGIEDFSQYPMRNEILKLLDKFKAISVREEEAVKGLSEIGYQGEKVFRVLDPCFLNFDFKLLTNDSIKYKNTIVSYCFEKNVKFYENLETLGQNIGFDIVSLNDNIKHNKIKSTSSVNVGDWLGYIKNSSFVLTNSFHCMVFAIIFKRNFAVIPANPTRVSRLKGLLKILNLEERFFDSLEDLNNSGIWNTPIDYSEVDKLLNIEVANSKEYLRKLLE